MDGLDRVKQPLYRIYGEDAGRRAFESIRPLIAKTAASQRKKRGYFSQDDVILITYGDSIQKAGQPPLAVLHKFAAEYLKGVISGIHLLPFFPYSSDDGFSVKDFFAVDPALGSWRDVTAAGKDFELMFDFVLNHFSSESKWFGSYLEDREGFREFAIEVDPTADLSQVTRPRSLPLLSEYEKKDGRHVYLWTTFSRDQIDFNYKCLDVLEKMIEVLLFYVQKGAAILRLDAIAYLWKEIGTHCIHLRQVHEMVKLFRNILDLVAPDVIIITETNVPHAENISYFGSGRDEAQMVYNFTLPPLLLHSFVKGDSRALSCWARGLHLESAHTTFFNFTASHDGIGLRPLEGILPAEAQQTLIGVAEKNGGRVSYKQNPDGTQSPYELNITYVDAILGEKESERAEKFLASQAVQLVLPGVPAIYIHSLLGSRNWIQGVENTGRARSINREKLAAGPLLEQLKDPVSFRSRVFYPYLDMIRIRRKQKAFHPNAGFEILDIAPGIFAIKRFSDDQTVYAVVNITGLGIKTALPPKEASGTLTDLITGETVNPDSFTLRAFQFAWLTSQDS